jgi:hypothetical protein
VVDSSHKHHVLHNFLRRSTADASVALGSSACPTRVQRRLRRQHACQLDVAATQRPAYIRSPPGSAGRCSRSLAHASFAADPASARTAFDGLGRLSSPGHDIISGILYGSPESQLHIHGVRGTPGAGGFSSGRCNLAVKWSPREAPGQPSRLLLTLRLAPIRVRCFGTGDAWYGHGGCKSPTLNCCVCWPCTTPLRASAPRSRRHRGVPR